MSPCAISVIGITGRGESGNFFTAALPIFTICKSILSIGIQCCKSGKGSTGSLFYSFIFAYSSDFGRRTFPGLPWLFFQPLVASLKLKNIRYNAVSYMLKRKSLFEKHMVVFSILQAVFGLTAMFSETSLTSAGKSRSASNSAIPHQSFSWTEPTEIGLV